MAALMPSYLAELVAGRATDLLVAEHVLGYRRVPGIPWDYDGPCEPGEHLLPPGVDPKREWQGITPPARGTIPFGWYVQGRYSERIEDAWQVIEHLRQRGIYLEVYALVIGYQVAYQEKVTVGTRHHFCDATSAPLAICRAALAASGETHEKGEETTDGPRE
jgi:hypothetical protein